MYIARQSCVHIHIYMFTPPKQIRCGTAAAELCRCVPSRFQAEAAQPRQHARVRHRARRQHMHAHIAETRVRGVQAFLALFCFVFAVNSAVHSYLVLRYSDGNKVAVNVGFYYMSNAAGRLMGTVLSGVLYSYAGATRADGFGWCFILSAAFGLLCAAITTAIRDNDAGLSCGSWTCVHGTEPADDREKEGEGREEGVVVVAPVAVEMRRGNGGSRDAGEVDGRAGLRWRDDERVDEVRQRDSTVFLAEERPAFLDWDGSEHAEAGDVRWHGRFGRTGHLSFPGTGPPVCLRYCATGCN